MKNCKISMGIILAALILVTCTACQKSNHTVPTTAMVASESSCIDSSSTPMESSSVASSVSSQPASSNSSSKPSSSTESKPASSSSKSTATTGSTSHKSASGNSKVQATTGGGKAVPTAPKNAGTVATQTTTTNPWLRNPEMAQKVYQIIGEQIKPGMSVVEKYEALYSYCHKIPYDSSRTMHEAEDALLRGKAVCDGHAKAFYVLCSTAGLNCDIITSTKMNHAWDIVKIGTNYYNIDTTCGGFLLADKDYFPTYGTDRTAIDGYQSVPACNDTSYTDAERANITVGKSTN